MTVQLTSLAVFVIFGVNWVLYTFLYLHKTNSSDNDNEKSNKNMSKPLELTLESIRSFSGELCKLGAILAFAYICENHPPFTPGDKDHSMDMVWGLSLLLLIVSLFNIRTSKGGEILNREQTEEWKGWMQFLFLMYHYFSAHEIYNPIRVFITCYVWMTGFGNFSFFYMKADYGAVRILQMLWRLNFLVFFLCMVMGNNYILYYICPLHTFYFFVVYTIMAICKKYNYTEHGMKVKLAVAAVVIFSIWDLDMNLFERVFWFLGDKPVEGAKSGIMWEWYFRTSLDHWSTFLGIIFALNYPATSLWLKKIEECSVKTQWVVKGSVGLVLLFVSSLWATVILPMGKLDYNQYNAYLGVLVPMLTYIYIRNITPVLRTRFLGPLHSIGKITLETYLMQHHVWMSGNAKKVLVFVPGFPFVNMVLVTLVYIIISKEVYRLTMSLRGMCLPDNLKSCLKNLAGIFIGITSSVVVAKSLLLFKINIFISGCIILALGILLYLIVRQVLLCAEEDFDGTIVSPCNIVFVLVFFFIVIAGCNIFENKPISEFSEEVVVNKDISGMGNVFMGLVVILFSCIMIKTKDSYHGLVRMFTWKYGGILDDEYMSWDVIYGDLLRKINYEEKVLEEEELLSPEENSI